MLAVVLVLWLLERVTKCLSRTRSWQWDALGNLLGGSYRGLAWMPCWLLSLCISICFLGVVLSPDVMFRDALGPPLARIAWARRLPSSCQWTEKSTPPLITLRKDEQKWSRRQGSSEARVERCGDLWGGSDRRNRHRESASRVWSRWGGKTVPMGCICWDRQAIRFLGSIDDFLLTHTLFPLRLEGLFEGLHYSTSSLH